MNEKFKVNLLLFHLSMAVTFNHCDESVHNTEFFLVRIFLYSVRIHENADQKKLCILTLFTQRMGLKRLTKILELT